MIGVANGQIKNNVMKMGKTIKLKLNNLVERKCNIYLREEKRIIHDQKLLP